MKKTWPYWLFFFGWLVYGFFTNVNDWVRHIGIGIGFVFAWSVLLRWAERKEHDKLNYEDQLGKRLDRIEGKIYQSFQLSPLKKTTVCYLAFTPEFFDSQKDLTREDREIIGKALKDISERNGFIISIEQWRGYRTVVCVKAPNEEEKTYKIVVNQAVGPLPYYIPKNIWEIEFPETQNDPKVFDGSRPLLYPPPGLRLELDRKWDGPLCLKLVLSGGRFGGEGHYKIKERVLLKIPLKPEKLEQYLSKGDSEPPTTHAFINWEPKRQWYWRVDIHDSSIREGVVERFEELGQLKFAVVDLALDHYRGWGINNQVYVPIKIPFEKDEEINEIKERDEVYVHFDEDGKINCWKKPPIEDEEEEV